MSRENVTIFDQYHFKVGQKIRLLSGKRSGDWLVISVSERKVGLRCPVSGKEVEWDRFCYFVETMESEEWPRRD